MKILLVDDSEDVRRAMRSLIEQNPKLEVCGEAENGQIAVEMSRQLRPDLVILDYSMPIQNGLDTALEIATIDHEVPLLLCTLYGQERVRKQALSVGITAVLSKDESLGEQLLKTIDSIELA
ncbi:MAG: hypothetical protein NVS1B11_19730 [Terriglobales bacterium]